MKYDSRWDKSLEFAQLYRLSFEVDSLKLCEHVTYAGLNKFKKRRFRSTVNLLTGATEVHPDLQQVRKLAPLFLPCSKTLNVNLGWEF